MMKDKKSPLGENFSAGDNMANRIASLLPNSAPELDLAEAIDGKFKSGQGVLSISPNLDDKTIALVIRNAIKAADGKPFTVIAPSN